MAYKRIRKARKSFLNPGLFKLSRPLLFVIILGLAGVGYLIYGYAASTVPNDVPHRGLIYAGLRKSDKCKGLYELPMASKQADAPLCTHGPDPGPEGVDIRQPRNTTEEIDQSTVVAPVVGRGPIIATKRAAPCYGTGSDGYRVQAMYVYQSGKPNRYSTFASSFQSIIQLTEGVYYSSGMQQGTGTLVRFVTNSGVTGCSPTILQVALTADQLKDFDSTAAALAAKGYNKTSRHYLVWADVNIICGLSSLSVGSSSSTNNGANEFDPYGPSASPLARIDNGCWNYGEPHELTHTLGAVQNDAPHTNKAYHCTDDYDVMCYTQGTTRDGIVTTPAKVVSTCASTSYEWLLDCNKDDYFSLKPQLTSYIGTHWNIAHSHFIYGFNAAPVGVVTSQSCNGAAGWTFDYDNTNTTLNLTATLGTTNINLGPTNVDSSVVNSMYGISGNHGFNWALPNNYKDGVSRLFAIKVKDAATSTLTTLRSTTIQCPDTVPPSTPTSLTSTSKTTNTVSLSWGASTDNVAVTGYRIYRNGTLVGTSSGTTYTDSGLSAATLYSYAVSAIDARGNESPKTQSISVLTNAICLGPTCI